MEGRRGSEERSSGKVPNQVVENASNAKTARFPPSSANRLARTVEAERAAVKGRVPLPSLLAGEENLSGIAR